MERAIQDLCRLSDRDLFTEVAEGVEHIIASVKEIDAAAHRLKEDGYDHPARLLRNLAKEEAAKVLILLDVVRCPKNRPTDKSRTLSYFHSHLAKGIYAQVCGRGTWWFFKDLREHIDRERRNLHLDGPNGYDWIWPNDITFSRICDIYVGYYRDTTEEGGQANRFWLSPNNNGGPNFDIWLSRTAPVVLVSQALHDIGATTQDGLSLIANTWRSVDLHDDMSCHELFEFNNKTLESMCKNNVLVDSTGDINSLICNYWTFPLWSLDLRQKDVKKKSLREKSRREALGHWLSE